MTEQKSIMDAVRMSQQELYPTIGEESKFKKGHQEDDMRSLSMSSALTPAIGASRKGVVPKRGTSNAKKVGQVPSSRASNKGFRKSIGTASEVTVYTDESTMRRLDELKKELKVEKAKRANVEVEIQQLRKTFEQLIN